METKSKTRNAEIPDLYEPKDFREMYIKSIVIGGESGRE